MVDELKILFKSLLDAKEILHNFKVFELQLIIILIQEELDLRERKEV